MKTNDKIFGYREQVVKDTNKQLHRWMVVFFGLILCTMGSKIQADVADGAVAAENERPDITKNPLGCRNVGYQYKLNTLSLLPEAEGDRQSLYFIFNRLGKTVTLYQMMQDESTRSVYLNHAIHGQQWAVLATSQKEMKYICTVEDPKSPRYGKIVSCEDSIKVCEYARVKFGLNNRGNYWLVSSNSRGGAVGDVIRYGIIPR